MFIEIHENLNRPQRIPCSRLVVYDNFNNPVMVAVETAPNIITTGQCNEPQFNDLLLALGINNSIIVSNS